MQAILFRAITTCVWVSLLCAATTASGQVTDSLATLQSSIKAGDRLRITDRAGGVTDGKLRGLSPDSVQLIVKRDRSFDIAESSLARIERVTRGTKRGALAGFVLGAVFGLVQASGSCNGGCAGPAPNGWKLAISAASGGFGAGVGALIGSATSVHRLVYEHK